MKALSKILLLQVIELIINLKFDPDFDVVLIFPNCSLTYFFWKKLKLVKKYLLPNFENMPDLMTKKLSIIHQQFYSEIMEAN